MPLMTRRSSTRSTPRTSVGRRGSIRFHCSSFSQNRFLRTIPIPSKNESGSYCQSGKLMSSDPKHTRANTGTGAARSRLDRARRFPEPAARVGEARVPGQQFSPHIFFGLDPMMVSTIILCITYAVIIWEKLNRAIVALLGASVMVFIGVLDQNEALKGIDWNTIGLLTGMMILVSVSRRSGMFEYLAIWSAQKAKANPAGILLLLQLTTAVVSALLDNVTTVLLVVPVTLAITKELDVPPYPFLFAEVFASNIGGTATLIGDPPNIMIGSLAGLDFNAFIIHLTPVIIVVMAAQALMIHLVWG